jgi:uncharacterized protein YjlB
MATIYTRAAKGSALTWTEGDANITNLNDDKIEAVVDDTSPQLGGNLDVNGQQIVTVSNGNIVLAPNGTGKIVVGNSTSATSITTTAEQNLILDTNFGGNSGFIQITAGTNGNITIEPNGTGEIILDGQNWPPSAPATNDQYLQGNSDGTLAWTDITQATGNELENVVEDTTPQLGGDLDVNGQQIVTVSNGNIVLAPNGTGKSKVNNVNYYETPYSLGTTSGTITPDVANGNVQTITLNGNLTFSAFSNPVAGQSMTLIIDTNATGRTLTSTMLFAGADKTISTTDTVDIISVFYDGTNYYASLAKGFA